MLLPRSGDFKARTLEDAYLSGRETWVWDVEALYLQLSIRYYRKKARFQLHAAWMQWHAQVQGVETHLTVLALNHHYLLITKRFECGKCGSGVAFEAVTDTLDNNYGKTWIAAWIAWRRQEWFGKHGQYGRLSEFLVASLQPTEWGGGHGAGLQAA